MRAFTRIIALAAVLALLLPACAAAGPRPLEKVRVAFPAKGASYAPYFIAIDKGYYADEGLEVEILDAAGNTGVAAVLAGEVDFTTSAGVALSAILQGAPMKVIFSHMDRPNYELWSSQPDVATLADLRGRPVGVIGRGDTMEISARLVLARAGLDPNGVAYTPLGPGNARVAAMQSGSVAAVLLTRADVEQLKPAGPRGRMLADVGQDVRMLFNGVATSDRLLRERPDVVAGFLRGTLKGREYFRRYRDESLDVVGRYNGQPRATNEADYQTNLEAMTPDGVLSEEAQLADTRVRAALVGAASVRPIEEVYDYRFARAINAELTASGWQPAR
jgi:NitT/TauT family transport system substrate-binding protein